MDENTENRPAIAPVCFTVDETAVMLRINRNAAYEAVRTGQIKAIRIGRSLRVPKSVIERLLGQPA